MFRKKQKNIFAVKKRRRGRNMLLVLIALLVLACVGVFVIYPMTRPINYTVTVEAGAGGVDPQAFAKNPSKGQVTLNWDEEGEPLWNEIGEYPVIVGMNGKTYHASVKVIDSTMPVAEAQEVTRFVDDTTALNPLDFVKDYHDATEVTAEFETEPDLTNIGTQPVVILLTDAGNNGVRLETSLTITDDQEAPVIYGTTDRLTYLGKPIPFQDGIAVVDDRDKNPKLEIDASGVDFNTMGVYPVTYRATDHAGNVTEIQGSMTVSYLRQSAVDIDTLNTALDGLLAEIITEDMPKEEQVSAVYDWAKTKMLISKNPSDKTAWTKEAYRAVRWNAGDSFTTSSFFHAAMIRLGYEDMMIQRTDGSHYWNLVNLGDGWYHVDASRQSTLAGVSVFLMTDAELKAVSEQLGGGFYSFDAAKYPEAK
ncbi:MAG: transglutaminase domain-containing protein [Firmicutes bacterium]|nr:transglutaminase domain-containing protein [Bacillota bacterium]